jgi:hypothetical protein
MVDLGRLKSSVSERVELSSKVMMSRERALRIMIVVGVISVAPSASADAAACIAASDNELTLRKEGKFMEARKELVACVDASCPAEVRADCALRLPALNAALPTVVISATDALGNDLSHVDVMVDGAPLTDTLDGRALSINPGSHVFRFEEKGEAAVEKIIVLREGEKDRRVTVQLGSVSPSPAAALQAAPPPRAWGAYKTAAVISASAGVVALGVGTALGLMASSDWSAAKADCNTTACSSATRGRAESEHDAALSTGAGSTAAFVVGAVGVAAGVVLWFVAPRAETGPRSRVTSVGVVPAIGTQSSAVMLGGRFE